jgi:hypothetical protein
MSLFWLPDAGNSLPRGDRSSHFSYREHPTEFNEMLRSFIGRNT